MADYTPINMQQNLTHNTSTTTVIAQIEDIAALEQLNAICQVKGVDCLFIGRMDLIVALGQTDPNAPKVLENVNKIVKVANKHQLATGMFIANLDELDH
jgi:2-keto-3-deoxy-L-rhamnonate aldolase RhmA